MGLRDFFRGKKEQKIAQPTTPTEGINSETVGTPVTSISSHASHSDRSNSRTQLTKGETQRRDLWDEAYTNLNERDPKLILRYEEVILKSGGENTKNYQNQLAILGSYQREEQLRQIAKNKVEEIDMAEWRLQTGTHSINISDQIDKAAKLVIAVKDFVSSAVSSEPHAALAWAGVCVFLPLLLNPTEQKSAAHDGLEAIPFVVRRLRVMERLIRQGNSENIEDKYPIDSAGLVQDFENTTIALYQTIIEFQIRFVKQYSQNWAKRYGRDLFKTDDWTTLTNQMKTLETRCTEISRDIGQENLERALKESDQKMQIELQRIQQELEKTARGIEQQTRLHSTWRQTDEERECIQLFRKSNPYENQKNRTPRRVLETGKWFLENQKFLDWRETEGSDLLWLSAMPGSGKSVLARTLIDENLTTLSHQENSVVCYFFFKDISPYQRSALSAISAILHQLFSAVPSLVKHALFPYEINGKDLLYLFDEMFHILRSAASDPAVGQVVCVLDALDECENDERVFLIEKITSFYQGAMIASGDQPKLKFLLTSRPYSNIHSQFHDLMMETPAIHLSGDQESEKIKDEIDHVIDVDVPKLAAKKGFNKEATEYLLDHLHQIENRTYLWLSLIMEEIRLSERPGNKRELQKIVSDLPRSLVDAFDTILKRCRHPDLARQLLHIILAAKQPLTVAEMKIATALADDLQYRSYEDISIESPEDFELRIKNICGFFVTVEDGSVFLIHQAAKDFLIQTEDDTTQNGSWKHSFKGQDSEELIATVCISLLSFDCFSKNPLTVDYADDDPDEVRDRASEYASYHPLLEYAAANWMEHATAGKIDDIPKWVPFLMSLCDIHKPVFQTWYTLYQKSGHVSEILPRETTPLNIAASSKFMNVVALLLKNGQDPNGRDGYGATPLARAVRSGCREAVELLLDANADINDQGWDEPWYSEVDEDGSEREIKPFSGTALTMAVISNDPDMVEYLISRGAEINFPPRVLLTPLLACLLQIVTDGDSVYEDAAILDDPDQVPKPIEICRLLLRHGANVCFENVRVDWTFEIKTPLHFAAEAADSTLLQMFVDSETADVNYQTWTILNISDSEEDDNASNGEENLVSIQGPTEKASMARDRDGDHDDTASGDVSTSDSDNSTSSDSDEHPDIGYTPLHLAVRARRLENVEVLLKKGADVNIRTAHGHSALDMALDLCKVNGSSTDNPELRNIAGEQIIALLQQYQDNNGHPGQGEIN